MINVDSASGKNQISTLYVDDEKDLLIIGKIYLERTGEFRVGTMTSAQEALTADIPHSFDVIVSDYLMPGMDGIDFLKAVREQYGDIPFILFTGRGREDVIIDAINNGIDFYLQKGGDPAAQFSELSHLIKKAIERKSDAKSRLKNEERLKFALEGAGHGIWDMDIVSGEIFLDQWGCEIIGYDPEEFPDSVSRWFDLALPEDLPAIKAAFQNHLDGITPLFRFELRVRTKSGGLRWVLIRGKVVQWDDFHKPLRMTGTLTDIETRKTIEKELLQSKKDWETIFRAIGNPAFILDNKNTIIDVNEALSTLTGKMPEELKGLKCWEILHSPDATGPIPGCPCDIMRRSLIMESRDIELSWFNKTFLISCTPVLDDQGTLEKVIHIAVDITKAKQLEDQVIETKDYLDQIFSSVQEGIVLIDATTHEILDINPAGARLMGAAREDILGKVCHEYICPEKRGDCPIIDLHTPVINSERILHTTDGRTIPIIKDVLPFHYKERDCFLETFHDDTIRIQARQELMAAYEQVAAAEEELRVQLKEQKNLLLRIKESEERFKELSKLLPVVVFETDLEGKLQYTNQLGMQTFGFSEEDFKKGITIFDIVSPRERKKASSHFFNLIKGSEPATETEYLLERGSGEKFPALVISNIYSNQETGTIGGVRGVVVDISRIKEIEHALKRSKEKLNLLSDITRHDIVNQINVLYALCDLIELILDAESPIFQYVTNIRTSIENIKQSIYFTRDYQKIGDNAPVWQNIHKIAKVAAIDNLPDTIGLTIHTGIYEVFADPMLMLVFFNLFDNAKRYGERISRISINFRVEKEEGIIFIEDDGIGISPEQKEEIFEKGVGKNTGLGLFLVRQILAITNLSIRETGIFGEGARFEILIPTGMWREGKNQYHI